MDVFNTSQTNIVECWKPWQASDFQAAKMLLVLTEEEDRQRRIAAEGADEEERLVLENNPEAFERMKRILTGEVEAVIPPEFEDAFRECDELARKLREAGGQGIG